MCALDIRPAIGTERLVLRGLTRADTPQLAELANDHALAVNTVMLPSPYGLADAEAFAAYCDRIDPRREAHFAVEHRQFGLMGMLGFYEHTPGRMEVGYWFGRPFWGRGYATEAVNAALRWAKSDWRRNVVWAGHFADNPASGQVLCKAGFLYTGDVEPRTSVARGGEAVPTRMMVWLA